MKSVPVFKLAETPLLAGTTLVEASAGTGKTYTIAGLYLRLILEQNLEARRILVVTYTKAATEELRNRIRQTLAAAWRAFDLRASDDAFLAALLKKHAGQEADLAARLRLALDMFDEAAIYTIHAFCQRVLKDRAFETGSLFDTELVTDQAPLLRQVVEDYWRKHFYRAGRLSVIVALNEGLCPDALLPFARDSLSRPFLKVIAPVDGKDIEALAAELERLFGSLRELWPAERATLRGLFGSGAKWANQPYNQDDEIGEAFRKLDACFGTADFPPSALTAVKTFCCSALAAKVNKRAKLPAPVHRFFDLCEGFAEAGGRYVMGVKLEALRYVEAELPRRKRELKILFYDDLLRSVHDALNGAGGAALVAELRKQYGAALIDEFQDTDPLQYDIFRRVFGGEDAAGGAPTSSRLSVSDSAETPLGAEADLSRLEVGAPGMRHPAGPGAFLFLIGDPKQAIYGFRGADVFTYLQAGKQAGRVFTLGENWRSESSLVRSVNTVFGASPQPFVVSGIGFHPVEAKGKADQKPLTIDGQRPAAFQLWFWKRTGKEINRSLADQQLPAVVATEIVRLLNGEAMVGGRKLLPEDIAVLVPRNRDAQRVQEALAQRNVPSVLYTDANLFDSREVRETQRVLAAVAEPTNEPQLLAALATDLIGYTGARIAALGSEEQERQRILERFRDYLELWLRKGFIQMFRSFMEREQVRMRLLAFPDGERRLTNLLHLSEVLHRVSDENRLGIAGLLKWMGEQCEAEGQVAEEHQLRLETDEKAVKLVTIHKSKGLEYPVVFCPFSWRGVKIDHGGEEQVFFHEPGNGGLVRDLGGPDYEAHKQLARVESLAENVRQLYVALTRAKHRCYFIWGAFRDVAVSAPAWLLHPPPSAKPDVVQASEEHFPQLDDSRLLADLTKLADQSQEPGRPPAMGVSELPEPNVEVFAPARSDGPALEYRRFTGAINRDWRFSSFTSLTANQGEEQPDYDELGATGREELPASGIFAFPGGAKPGTCLHKILEKLDFTQWSQPDTVELVREQLRMHGLPDVEFTDVVVKMLGSVMTAPLDDRVPGLALQALGARQRLNELEFYFPLKKIAPNRIARVLKEHRYFESVGPGMREPEGLSFTPVQGMLKGFIDLVFEFSGRFYIVDWKSNLLGTRVEDYGTGALAEEIRRRHYYFQYQLYTVALDRYLRLRLPGYQYERHFGGVYYLFLRGIDPARLQFGIHRDRLSEPLVRELGRLLIGSAGEGDTAHA